MSQQLALEEARRLQQLMHAHGVTCTIELKAGRAWSGDPWWSDKHVLMNHHTAGASTGLTPSYALCRDGRPGLPGPLCNGYGGRDLVYRIITMGLANHPGSGGPLTVDGFTIPRDSARISAWGTEWEHDGRSPWPASMRQFMGRANAALLAWRQLRLGRSVEHSTWAPARKIDRSGYTAATGQAEIRPYLTAEDFDVGYSDWPREQREHLLRDIEEYAVWGRVGGRVDDGEPMADRVRRIEKDWGWALGLLLQNAGVDEQALAEALLPSLAPLVVQAVGDKAGLTRADVESAVRKVLGSLAEQKEEPAP